ncbi:unnamed protein product [Boreogadus saida]
MSPTLFSLPPNPLQHHHQHYHLAFPKVHSLLWELCGCVIDSCHSLVGRLVRSSLSCVLGALHPLLPPTLPFHLRHASRRAHISVHRHAEATFC